MKSTVFLVTLILLSNYSFSQQKGRSAGAYNFCSEKVQVNFARMKSAGPIKLQTYPIELFPDQVFNGWWFCWSDAGAINCVQKETPEVNWLNITPGKFTSKGCNDIIPVKYSFVAPKTEGVYITTVIDSLRNWDTVRVRLTVTKSPGNFVNMKFGINKDSLSYKRYLRRVPLNFDKNKCVVNYYPSDTIRFSNNLDQNVNWLKFSPSSGALIKDQILDLKTLLLKNPYDSTWVVFSSEYSSWPAFSHYFIRQTEPKDYMIHFNGTNVISSDYLPNSSTKTLMYWVRYDAISSQGIGAHDFANHRFYLGVLADNTLYAGMGNAYTPVTYLNLIPNKWYHLAMTTSRTHDSAYVYLNATEVSRFAYSFSGVSRANLYIGARNDSINSFRFPVQGIIDDVQVWERPLSRNEILQYMFTPPAGKEQGLVLYYPFNEGWGDFTKNAVDNYLDGVLYWAPQWISLANKPKTWAELMTSVKGYYPESDNTLMLGCHPNPSGKFTCINFNLPERGRVLLQLFDIHGMLLKTLLDSELPNGNQEYRLNDPSLPKGTYFVKLAFSNSKASKVQSIKIIHSGL